MEISLVFFWLVLAIIVGIAANTRGRNGVAWFLLAVVISPLLGGLLVLALPRLVAPVTTDATNQNASNQQMMFDALPEDAKQRVRDAQAERQRLALLESERRERREKKTHLLGVGILCIIVAALAISQCMKTAPQAADQVLQIEDKQP
jgi:hypothetical protein